MEKWFISTIIFAIFLVSFVSAVIPRQEAALSQAEKDTILTKLKFSDKVSDEVISQLEDKNKIRVIVSLDDANLDRLKKLEKIRPKIKENQQQVLKNIPGLNVIYQYNNINSMAIEVDARDLDKLEALGVVSRISEDKPMYLSLQQSVPQIGANYVQNFLNYTGKGQTVCIVDTGVNYTHPAIGSSSCNIEPISYEDYSASWTWGDDNLTITKPGYSRIAVHFSEIFITGDWGNYEKIEIYNGSDVLYQTIFSNMAIGSEVCENILDRWSVSVPGDTIKIHFIPSDLGNICYDYGGSANYSIDKVSNYPLWPNCGDFVGGFDFMNNDINPIDDNGHGTHIAGIITSNDSTYKGVASDTKIFAAKVFPASGDGSASVIARGIDYCIDMKNAYNIKIISLSLGDKQPHDSACDSGLADAEEVNVAFNNGIFVDVASGNEGFTDGISSPACASGATSVGAVYDANVGSKSWSPCTDSSTFMDKLVCFTNRGSLLDLLAPGAVITSANLVGGFVDKSGTSMAAPHVAGLAALMLEANSTLNATQIEYFMKSTGVLIEGYKRINATAAIMAVMPVAPAEFISITLGFNSIDFGNVNPNDTKMISNYNITIDSSTNVNVDLYMKGTNFTVDNQNISIQNMSWINDSLNKANAFIMKENYDKNITNIASGKYLNMTYWLSIPPSQTAASNYQSSITIKAVKTGTSP